MYILTENILAPRAAVMQQTKAIVINELCPSLSSPIGAIGGFVFGIGSCGFVIGSIGGFVMVLLLLMVRCCMFE